MGKHERIEGENSLPMRRVVFPQADGSEREMWVYDTSDVRVQEWLREGAKAIVNSPSYADDMAWIEAVQCWPPDDLD